MDSCGKLRGFPWRRGFVRVSSLPAGAEWEEEEAGEKINAEGDVERNNEVVFGPNPNS
jgi:hypothetical protein